MDKMTLRRTQTTYTEKQYMKKLDAAIKNHPMSFKDRASAYREAFIWLTQKFAKQNKKLVTPEFYQGAAVLYGKFENDLPKLLFTEQEIENGIN